MKLTYILLIFLFIGNVCFGQEKTFIHIKGNKLDSFDTQFASVIDTIRERGVITGFNIYENWNEPPEATDIIKAFLFNGPDTVNNWKITFIKDFDMHGYTEGVYFYTVVEESLVPTSYFKVYRSKMYINYGNGQGYTIQIRNSSPDPEKNKQ